MPTRPLAEIFSGQSIPPAAVRMFASMRCHRGRCAGMAGEGTCEGAREGIFFLILPLADDSRRPIDSRIFHESSDLAAGGARGYGARNLAGSLRKRPQLDL